MWVHVKCVKTKRLSSPDTPVSIVLLTSYSNETRVLRLDYETGIYALVLPNASQVPLSSSTLKYEFVSEFVVKGPFRESTYKRTINCRIMANTKVTLVPSNNSLFFEDNAAFDRWIDSLEDSAECMAAELMPECDISRWVNTINVDTCIDMCSGDERLFDMMRSGARPSIIRRYLNDTSIVTFLSMYLFSYASGFSTVSEQEWIRIFKILFINLGLDGSHYYVSAYRRFGEISTVPFETAIKMGIDLRSPNTTMRDGMVTFHPVEIVGECDKESVLSGSVMRVIGALNDMVPLQNVMSEDSVSCWSTVSMFLDERFHVANDDSFDRVPINKLPQNIRYLLGLEARDEVRRLVAIVCSFMLTDEAVKEYFDRVSCQEHGHKRCKEIKAWMKNNVKSTKRPSELISFVEYSAQKLRLASEK